MTKVIENKQELINFLKQNYPFDPRETDANNFTVEAAIYWFAYDNHSGQTSELYSILSTSDYQPGMINSIKDENEETQICYKLLLSEYTDVKIPSDYEIINHGIDYPDYFPGCGTTFTGYTDVGTGIGNTPHEALDDALEQLAIDDWYVEDIENDLSEESEIDDGDTEANYYVSVRIK